MLIINVSALRYIERFFFLLFRVYDLSVRAFVWFLYVQQLFCHSKANYNGAKYIKYQSSVRVNPCLGSKTKIIFAINHPIRRRLAK